MVIIDELENQLMKDLRDDNVNGSLSAAIVRKDKMIWSKAFGHSNPNGETLSTTDTIYRVASITKSFTAFLMMRLIEDGFLELDRPIEEFVPEIRSIGGYSDLTKITFRQLAGHTAGLVREPKLEKADSGPIEEWVNKVLQSIPATSFESKPGERFSYSNIGYGILGVALARAGNQPFIELIEEKIFKPLYMDNSFFVVPEQKLEHLARGIGGGPFGDDELDLDGPQREHQGRGYKVPNGGIYSTTADLAKFLMCNLQYPDLLPKHALELMHTKQTPEASYHGYGLGFEVYEDRSMRIAGHSGGMWGYSSHFSFEKEYGYGVILMKNYNWGTTSWDIGPKVTLRKLVAFEKTNGAQQLM